MQPLTTGDLQIVPHVDPACVRLTWNGRSRARDPGSAVLPYVREACQAAKASGATLEMRFDVLEYMNSSTITAIVETIQLAKADGVPLVIIYDQKVRWQRSSFDVLAVFAEGGALELRSV
jgi:hypothetical protein